MCLCIAWLWILLWNVSPAAPTQTHLRCPKATSAEFHFTWMHAKWHFLWWKENFFETPIPVPHIRMYARITFTRIESKLSENENLFKHIVCTTHKWLRLNVQSVDWRIDTNGMMNKNNDKAATAAVTTKEYRIRHLYLRQSEQVDCVHNKIV